MQLETIKITLTGKIPAASLFILAVSVLVILTALNPLPMLAAVGCDLNAPGRDIKLLFPESTGF
ncbi:MAG: hypothetical protein NUW07_10540, partial [Candidatus Saccharicenans sp.]|nr:hypothetical protein [Candidatus Saccharicenans sp.]